jgi:hypothetical protein
MVSRFVTLTAALTLVSCSLFEPNDDLVLYVGAQRVDCVGVGPQKCLLVKEQPQAEWQYFYDSIEGFTHEVGYEYKLLVTRRRIANPPADASSLSYRLVRVLERKSVPTAQKPATSRAAALAPLELPKPPALPRV